MTQPTEPDEIHIERIDPQPLTKEHLDWIEKMGWGIIQVHKVTRKQLEELFDVKT